MNIGNKTIKMQLWDTAGQERFRNLIPNYIRDCNVAIIVYDVTSIFDILNDAGKESFESLSYWIKEVKDITQKNATIVMVGNKSDLETDRYDLNIICVKGNKKRRGRKRWKRKWSYVFGSIRENRRQHRTDL